MLITHLIFSLTTGGAETMLVDIANEQVRMAHTVNVIIINDHLDDSLLASFDPAVSVFRIGRKPGSRNPWYFLKLNRMLLHLQPDIIHCHTNNIAKILLPTLRKKSVLTVHTVGVPTTYLRNYARLYAISKTVQEDIFRRSACTSILVTNGIRLEEIPSGKKMSVSETFRIVVIGRLIHEIKGQHVLIEAIRILVNKGVSSIRVDMVGEGGSLDYLKDLVDKYNLNDYICFTGLKSRHQIYHSLQTYHLLVQPSIVEGFGLTVIEGMIARIPVLVSGSGPVEIVGENKYGFSFPAGDAEKCADGIIRIMENYNELALILEEAGLYAEREYSVQRTAKKYVEEYNQLIS